METEIRRRVAVSGYDAPGFAQRYDEARPRPPEALRTLVPPLVGGTLRRVVDLGSGTGLSTRMWADVAEAVIGIEPSAAMRDVARRATAATNVRYVEGSGQSTSLASASVDLVTAAQSLHWMEPAPTLREIARILRPGGVLLAYEYFKLVTPAWALEVAYDRLRAAVSRISAERGIRQDLPMWPVSTEAIRASGWFEDVRETAVHSVERGSGARLVDMAMSEGSLLSVLAAGVSEEEVGLAELRRVAATVTDVIPWWIGYRVWLARRGDDPTS